MRAPLVGLWAALVGCVEASPKEKEEDSAGVCCENARASVSITVADAAGDTDLQADVYVSVDGGDFDQATCTVYVAYGSGLPEETRRGNCTHWNTGIDTPGTFLVRAEADGYAPAEAVVDAFMDEDGCHVETEFLDLILKP